MKFNFSLDDWQGKLCLAESISTVRQTKERKEKRGEVWRCEMKKGERISRKKYVEKREIENIDTEEG
jgi:hypothetical protein